MKDLNWNENEGMCPVSPNTRVDIKFSGGGVIENYPAGSWNWGLGVFDYRRTISHWRLHNA